MAAHEAASARAVEHARGEAQRAREACARGGAGRAELAGARGEAAALKEALLAQEGAYLELQNRCVCARVRVWWRACACARARVRACGGVRVRFSSEPPTARALTARSAT